MNCVRAKFVFSIFLPLFLLAAAAKEMHFPTEIIPVLTKAGCNAGACHGAATGQGGFHLSLLGYDPEEDYWRITREFTGRRVDLDDPASSLILKKASRQIDHEGGRRIKRDSQEFQTLLDWIKTGVPFGSKDLHVTRIEADPVDVLLDSTNQQTQITVKAFLSDGRIENATPLALFTSNDDAIADVNSAGLVTTRSRGLTSIMVRYAGQVAAVRVAIPFSDAKITGFSPANFIDEEVLQELRRLGLPPSSLATDQEFLRRVSIDLTGWLPATKLARKVLAQDPSQSDRCKIVDDLLDTPEFVDLWTMHLADLLLINGKRGSEDASLVYYDWLREQIALNKSWKDIALSLVTASGDINQVGPANFSMLANDPRDLAERASEIFLGAKIGCARCHAHPSDRWTQRDYYQFSAFFAGLSREGGKVSFKGGSLDYPKTKTEAPPKPLGAPAISLTGHKDPRLQLAEWMTSPDNSMFARAFVNRVWKHLFARGLVEPDDDLRPTNPASIPKLLDRLAAEFIRNNYDLKWLVRTIANSRTYQLSSRPNSINQSDQKLFSHYYVKPLPAAVLVDAIAQVTGVPEKFSEDLAGLRAVQLPTPQTPSYALDVLGRCKREGPCETAGSGGGLAQALHMINGTTINSRLEKAAQDQLQHASNDISVIIEEFYLRALTRYPSANELKFWLNAVSAPGNQKEHIEDFLWTLLNSREFRHNH